jgi:hypothetical protein
MNKMPVGGRSSETWSHPVDMFFFCFFFVLLFFSLFPAKCAGSEVKPLTEDRGCDSVLLGQSDLTPHGAVIDEYGAMVE